MTDTGAGLSPKHAAFVDEFLKDRSATAAAQRAGYSPRSAAGLMALLPIKDEIRRRLAAIATEANVTAKSLIAEAEVARETAEAGGNASAMVAAIKLKAELTGNLDAAQPASEPVHATHRETAHAVFDLLKQLGYDVIIRKRALGSASVRLIGDEFWPAEPEPEPEPAAVSILDQHAT